MDFILRAEDLKSLQNYLHERKWIAPDEQLNSASIPGEGNMNYTLRIRTNFRTFIIKQSRDYVEKYPQIPAPRERAIIEGQFYELIQQNETLRSFTPEISYIDKENSIIVLEDLGESSDFTFIYQKEKEIDENELIEIVRFASVLHNEFNASKVSATISNRAMRELNAEHIFNYPLLEENGFDLDTVTPGLQEVAMKYKTDTVFKDKVKSLSAHYLNDGPILLHGDYYPGSWLKILEGVRIIDPEFCFFGPAEFDLSVMLAHMKMAEQPASHIDLILDHYQQPTGFNIRLMHQLTGIEIVRRIIGLAQLPLSLSLTEKETLLEEAYDLIVE